MSRLDRRGPNRGDQRRDAILRALDELLRGGALLDDINVAQVSEAAGVTLSALYFYFENKAIAVMALLEQLYDEVAVATDDLLDTAVDPGKRIRATITSLFDAVDHMPHAYRALLHARAGSPTVRDDWSRGLHGFAEEVAAMITDERAAGRAPAGADADVLALALIDLNDRAVERYALGEGPDRTLHVDALTSVWLRSIYGGN